MATAPLAVTVLCMALAQPPAAATPNGAIKESVEKFLTCTSPDTRNDLLKQIEEDADGDVAAIARALAQAQVWPKLPAGGDIIERMNGDVGGGRLSYRLPDKYDPARSYPAVLCVSGGAGDSKEVFDAATWLLGARLDEYVLIHANGLDERSAWQDDLGNRLAKVLHEASIRVHLDRDRVFLFGDESGADSAWSIALLYPHLFAGAVVVNGFPSLPYASQTYPFLLANLRSLPFVAVDHANGSRKAQIRLQGMLALAGDTALPLSVARVSAQSTSPHPKIVALLDRRRSPGSTVSHWFRYRSQGRAGWLRQTQFSGDIWRAETLSIVASPSVDRNKFIADTIKGKLAYLGGRIEGQNLTVETRRCASIDVELGDGLIDWDQPITIVINGKKRFEGVVKPSVRTLLETAFENRDFARPVLARLSFSVRTDAP